MEFWIFIPDLGPSTDPPIDGTGFPGSKIYSSTDLSNGELVWDNVPPPFILLE